MALTPTQRRKRKKYLIGSIFLAIMTLAIGVGVSQIQVVREFLSRASGEEAFIMVDTQAVIGPMPRPWRNLAQGGEQHDWQMDPIIGQVRALNPRYIRLDHIYDFYDIVQGTPGNLSFNFSKFDAILDDIKATGATPYIALSYMPPAISSGDIVAPPVNWNDWALVVQKTIEHVSGTRNTPNVYYEVWNEPDLFGGWKYYGERNYLTLYSYAAQGAARAQVRQSFKIGGPAITALYKNWFDALLKHASANNLRLDFFSWHRYTNDLEQYKKDMTEVQTWALAYPQFEPFLEYHITEWGHDSNNHAGYDSNYSAAHTVAGAIEMVGIIDNAFVFEIQDGKSPEGKASWGRWGLLQHQDFGSVTKPRYRGLKLLDRIGPQRIQLLGKGSWVKGLAARTDQDTTQIILANYDRYGAHRETVPVTFTNIEPGTYQLKTEFLSGQPTTQQVATTAAMIRFSVPMTPNNVALMELTAVSPVTLPTE